MPLIREFGWTPEYIDSHPRWWRIGWLNVIKNDRYSQKFAGYKTMKSIQKAGLTMSEYQEWNKQMQKWGFQVPKLR